MRFNFDWNDDVDEEKSAPPSSVPKVELEWLPLHRHPVFTDAKVINEDGGIARPSGTKKNHLAWDGGSLLFFWDSKQRILHCITLRFGDPEPALVMAASPSKALQADKALKFEINEISLNRSGSAMLLTGSNAIYVMYLFGQSSSKLKARACKTVAVGSSIFSSNAIHILQATWHPHSETHFGVLSSDSVFRLYDLSSNLEDPEQEYFLQPVESRRSWNAASIFPIDFSFGDDHLWDKFSVFILFADGSLHNLCPVVPFGSVHQWQSILEVYDDTHMFGQTSSNSRAVCSSSLAISWLEAAFPELSNRTVGEDILWVKACPYTFFDASLSLQGPLQEVFHDSKNYSDMQKCKGQAVSFFHSAVGEDSIIVTIWAGGQLQIDALADEIQPAWKFSSRPRLRVDSHNKIIRFSMICEFDTYELSVVNVDQDLTAWSGQPPHLLRLAVVDLSLDKTVKGRSYTLYRDPLVPEKLYCVHNRGVDLIVLHSLPFTSLSSGKCETMRCPSVNPVLTICQGETPIVSALSGFVPLSHSSYSWIVAVTSTFECLVLETKTRDMFFPLNADMRRRLMPSEVDGEDQSCIVNEQILRGPAVVIVSSDLKLNPVGADSAEGREALHKFSKLFYENYMKYAYKVYFEFENHASLMEGIFREQLSRLDETHQKLVDIETKQKVLDNRLKQAKDMHNLLTGRMQNLRKLPGAQKNLLSKKELEFKCQLDSFKLVELHAMRSSIEALSGRLRRYRGLMESKPGKGQQHHAISRCIKNHTEDVEMSKLRSSMQRLSVVNRENTKKVKLLESALGSKSAIGEF